MNKICKKKVFISVRCMTITFYRMRSYIYRRRGLECSCDNLPTNLVLVNNENGNKPFVVGHSKITAIPSLPEAAFIESGNYFLQSNFLSTLIDCGNHVCIIIIPHLSFYSCD